MEYFSFLSSTGAKAQAIAFPFGREHAVHSDLDYDFSGNKVSQTLGVRFGSLFRFGVPART